MAQLYVLFEHAAGYALLRVTQFEEIGAFLPQVEKSVQDLNKFQSVVKLISFYPFKNAANALDNINNISEGVLHADLHLFLETNMPKPGKSQSITLGVADSKIGAAITEALGMSCSHTGVVPEILRGVRYHFHNLVKGFTAISSAKAQLGLGHSYSRCKVKFNVNRVDNMIIQSISLLDQLDKDINTFAMRIREWYSYHFPELIKIVPDNYSYARAAKFIGNRKELTEDKAEALEELVMDSAKTQAIFDAARSSMGMDISSIDLINIERFADRVISLAEYRKSLQSYLKNKMTAVAPNLSTLIGDTVGARLISHAGSLTNLAKYPASTVQILGAEKALFRALKTRGNTPKYGLIFHSTFIGRAAAKNKGRISRYLANKCSIASRIDCFAEIPSNIFGEKLRDQVEERLNFYETGNIPRKNVEVMKLAIAEASEFQAKYLKKMRKKEKKLKLQQEAEEDEALELNDSSEVHIKKEKKKKKKKQQDEDISMEVEDADESLESSLVEIKKSKKKKRKQNEEADDSAMANSFLNNSENGEVLGSETPKKKKKKKNKSFDE